MADPGREARKPTAQGQPWKTKGVPFVQEVLDSPRAQASPRRPAKHRQTGETGGTGAGTLMKWQGCPHSANCLRPGLLEAWRPLAEVRAAQWVDTQPLLTNPVSPLDLFYTLDVGTRHHLGTLKTVSENHCPGGHTTCLSLSNLLSFSAFLRMRS